MLQRIRDNASGPLAYVVVAVITLVFGVWGIGSYFTPSADPVVANVGGTDITRNQLENAYQQRYQRLRQMMGENFDPSILDPQRLRATVLEGLINREVMDQYAQQAGYRVTDAALLGAIRNNTQFQQNGEFSPQRYRALLAQAGIAPAQYEASLRQDLTSRQLRNEITDSAFAAPAEVDQAYRLANQQRRLRYLAFDPANYRDGIEVSDADIQTYYDEHPDAFKRPERVKLSYVSLDRGNAAADAGEPDEQTLRTLFDQNKQQFGDPERRSGGFIRVPIGDNADTARDTVQQVASAEGDLEARAAADQGVDYESIDSATPADLPEAVANTLFELKPDTTSSPVKGSNAWYLVHLSKITPASEADFDDPKVQAQLKAIAEGQQTQQAYSDKSDRLESLAYEAPNDLKTLADELGLEIQTTDWITREQGAGIGQYDAVRKAAFTDAVLKDKLNSTPIQLGAERQVVVRVSEHEPATRQPLAEVKDDIRERVIARQASAKAQDAADAALEKAKAGTSLQTLAADGATLEQKGFVQRSDRQIDPRILEAAFNISQPSEDSPGFRVTPTRDGRIALVAVDAMREAPADEAGTPRERFASQQRQYMAGLEYAVLGEYLRTQTDIEINEDRIN
ncbi:PpiC-type peptidyl-prolyl cis-trans isomerase [Salinisphaera sp. T5B8]|uniref:SurA N-terminal domain-containing protein n=1 Tax=Salinisphaera sp. T5B8 TaxID=1304154 RepID=UPI003342CC95